MSTGLCWHSGRRRDGAAGRMTDAGGRGHLGQAQLLPGQPRRYNARTLPKRLLSIIVPVFNEEEFVAAAIERALRAPLPDGIESEVVAIDDGSTDGSSEILDELAAAHPGRVRVFH